LLLKNCRPDLQRLVLGALYTGCRSLELLRLRACDVGRDGYGIYVAPSKTHKPRFVFLPDEGMAFFLALTRNRPAQALLFTRDDGRPWSEYYRVLFKGAARAAALPEDFSFHGLRHTYASQLVQAGAPLTVVSDQLGHVNTVTVSRTYGHVSPQIRESEVRQRFTVLEPKNAQSAERQKRALARWRVNFHGSSWRTYAKIRDLRSTQNAC
jgi:integrase